MNSKVENGAAIYLQNSLAKQPKHIVDGNDFENDIVKDKSALATIESILKHKTSVKNKLIFLAKELEERAKKHDDSKGNLRTLKNLRSTLPDYLKIETTIGPDGKYLQDQKRLMLKPKD